MGEPLRRIAIVGGGTAGWLSALYLATCVGADEALGRPRILLIDSSEIGIIGVGESTLPSLKRSLAFLGCDEADWMLRCNSTFKISVKFEGWCRPAQDGTPSTFWNPVESLRRVGERPISAHWLRTRMAGATEPFDYSCFVMPYLADVGRVPLLPGAAEPEIAYHVDAGLLAVYLAEEAVARGVEHIDDVVLDVALDERGFIEHLVTRNNGSIDADLFIDCSGFRGLLINRVLNEPFVPYGDTLLCDRAIAIPVPRTMATDGERDGNRPDHQAGIDPFTTATALDCGWAWNVPLVSRDGTGYVYSGAFASESEAEEEFRRFLGPRCAPIEARHLKMRVGRSRNSWVRNCVAVGLAGGFVEPLEATGIFLIEYAIQTLLRNFPDRTFEPAAAAAFNATIGRAYDDVRDFIVLHYWANDRRDTPFWQATKDVDLPSSLLALLERFEQRLPERGMFAAPPFREATYTCILLGMGYWRDRPLPPVDDVDLDEAWRVMQDHKAAALALRTMAPDHRRYLVESARSASAHRAPDDGGAAWWR